MTTLRQKQDEFQRHAKGVSPKEFDKICQRACEIAMNQGRPSQEPQDEDWNRAERELLSLQTSRKWDEKINDVCKKAGGRGGLFS